jgi:hypothetical protein
MLGNETSGMRSTGSRARDRPPISITTADSMNIVIGRSIAKRGILIGCSPAVVMPVRRQLNPVLRRQQNRGLRARDPFLRWPPDAIAIRDALAPAG